MSLNIAPTNFFTTLPHAPKRQPQENLQVYVKSAQIPKPKYRRGHPLIPRGRNRIMPPGGFLLPIYPNRCCLLREMGVFKPDAIAQKVKTFIQDNIPSQPVTTDIACDKFLRSSKDFYLPAPGFVSSVEPLPLVKNAVELAQATLQVLKTAERVVNLVWSAGQDHVFAPQTPLLPVEGNTPFCLPLFYAKIKETDEAELYRARMKIVIILMTPWALSRADMHDMLMLKRLPSIKSNGSWPRWNRAHKVWAQIEEYCRSHGSSFFVLTTYEHWIFGSFHPDSYSQLVSTNIISYTDSRPFILEWLIFWCASALQVPGSWNAKTNDLEMGYLEEFYPKIMIC
ncbi:hypothetical protein Clacol_008758 [Clathrus columnatus]|uniref:Uncharacterized protein n=1 Tax=Clathrus columnatus TaxID=1419009 RepID=A0AAV5AMY1_9AGAM|nr:hypothetical protein Clacol_008758 [Clathrus columnatus]